MVKLTHPSYKFVGFSPLEDGTLNALYFEKRGKKVKNKFIHSKTKLIKGGIQFYTGKLTQNYKQKLKGLVSLFQGRYL